MCVYLTWDYRTSTWFTIKKKIGANEDLPFRRLSSHSSSTSHGVMSQCVIFCTHDMRRTSGGDVWCWKEFCSQLNHCHNPKKELENTNIPIILKCLNFYNPMLSFLNIYILTYFIYMYIIEKLNLNILIYLILNIYNIPIYVFT